MPASTLEELFVEGLQDVYDAEQQILKALPKLAEATSSASLKTAFTEHVTQTEGQVQRLEQVFAMVGEKAEGKPCAAMKGLVTEGDEKLKEIQDPEALDAALIAAAQKVEHYEIATYGTLRSWARRLGHQDAARLLQQTLDEEGETDHKLTRLAEQGGINKKAQE